MRKSFDHYFMDIARTVATRATCDRLHVGAVVVRARRIVATGYNGSPPGEAHCDDVGHLMVDGGCQRTIHAEANALLHADRDALVGATLYVTHRPCFTCLKLIRSAGVLRVVYAQEYRKPYPPGVDVSGLEQLP